MTRHARVRVTGGPSPVDITATVDGKKLESVSRIELVLDVNDVVRAKITHVAQVLFDGEAIVGTDFKAELKERRPAPGGEPGDVIWVTTHTGKGLSRAIAVRDLAGQLDAEDREPVSGQ
jgi:hypothetical protein